MSEGLRAATVRLSPALDRLFVTPRTPGDRNVVLRAVRDRIPPGRVRSVAEGIAVRAEDAPLLLDGNGSEVRLRWRPEARLFAENRLRVSAARAGVLAEIAEVLKAGAGDAGRRLVGRHRLEILDEHQLVNVAAMTTAGGFGLCLFDEQGAGKTVSCIYAFDELVARDEIDFALIVAPKSMVSEWPMDFRRFMGDFYTVVVASGSRAEKRRALASRADVVVTNYETAVSMEPELRALLGQYGLRALLVVDESFAIKNLDAARTRALRRLREWAGRAFVLCGTPAPNSAEDVVQQVNLVDYGAAFDGIELPTEKHAAQALVQRVLERSVPYVRHLKRDVLPDLPAKRFSRVMLSLEPVQLRLYEAAVSSFADELRSVDDRTFLRNLPTFLAKRSALLQICSNPAGIDPNYSEVPAKLLALDELLDELIGRRNEKVVVWSYYTASIEGILRRFKKYSPLRYDGRVELVSERREAVRRFQADGPPYLLVANPAAAGAGLTLHRARYAVYESMSNQGAHYLQSLDRIHRRGQTREVEYLILLAQGTVEVSEYEILTRKEAAAQELLRDQVVPTPTRDTMLAEVLALAGALDELKDDDDVAPVVDTDPVARDDED